MPRTRLILSDTYGRPSSSSLTSGARRSLRAITALTLLLCCSLLSPFDARGQNIQYTKNAADLKLRGGLTVNPSSQALEIQIALGSYPGRAGLSVPVSISYSSKVWRVRYEGYRPPPVGSDGQPVGNGYTIVSAQYAENSKSGWTSSIGFPVLDPNSTSESYDQFGNPGCSSGPCYFVDRLLVRTPDGASHELRSTDQPYAAGAAPGDNLYAVDGSRLRYRRSTQTLYMPDGSRYTFADRKYTDRHGNSLTYGATGVTDTLGRLIKPPTLADAPGDATFTPLGATGAYTFKWRRLGDAGVLTSAQPLNFYADTGCPHGTGAYSPSLFDSALTDGCIANASAQHNPVVLHQIVLPTGRAYTFTYNVYGEIDKVVYPTGGYERFEYAQTRPLSTTTYPYVQANRGVVRRFVSETGAAAGEALWEYGDLGSSGVVSVTAPDGSRTDRFLHTDSPASGSFGYSSGGARAGMAHEERVYSAPDGNGVRRMLRRRLTEWAVTGSNATALFAAAQQRANRNPRVTKEVEIILDRTGKALAKTTAYDYDLTHQFSTGVNRTSVSEYGFAEVEQATAQSGAVASIPAGPLVRKTETTFLDAADQSYRDRNILGLPTSVTVRNGANVAVTQTTTGYDETAYPLLACGATVGWADPGTTVRGNPITTSRWLDTAGAWVTTRTQFDHCGNVRRTWDAGGNQTQVEYDDSFSDGMNRNTFALPTRTVSPVPDPSGVHGSATGLETATTYEFTTGLVTSTTDANGRTTTYSYSGDDGLRDPLNRLRKVTRPSGGGWTKYSYGVSTNAGRSNHFARTENALDATRSVVTHQFYDGLGRPNRTFAYEGAAAATYITADKQYDVVGRVWRVSTPYRSAGSVSAVNPSGHWTTTAYDALGRVVSVTTPDDPARDALPAGDPARQNPFPKDATVATSYDGNRVRVTDQAGKTQDSYTDALGRLDGVVEDPLGLAYGTTYEYDALDNLREVAQGTQRRYFMYDSLGRLIRAKNPEQAVNAAVTGTDPVTANTQWSLSYAYDDAGNLAQRTDPRGVTTTYTYDALNRNTTVGHAGGAGVAATPGVSRYYDLQTNARGSLWKTSSGSHYTELLDRDANGRPARNRQWFLFEGVWRYYDTTYAYDLAGNVTGQTYPSGRTTSYAYDAAGRPSTFSGTLGDGVSRTYVAGTSYDEAGRVRQEQYGTAMPVYNKSFYNPRGQLSEIRVSTYSVTTPGQETNWNRGALINRYSNQTWAASGSDNNGNLLMQMVYVPADDAISGYQMNALSYTYDALNRLDKVEELADGSAFRWRQDYDYDRWGNRTINATNTTAGIPERQFTVNAANNRLGVPTGQAGTMAYDNAGNLTTDTYSGNGTRAYDAENRMTQETAAGGLVTGRYAYDGDGRRVRRAAGGQEWWYVYGLGGELVAEYGAGFTGAAQQEYGYRNGRLLVTASGQGEQGLQGDYFNSLDFTAPALTRTDPTVNFNWDLASPGAGVRAEEFTVRWTGYVTPRYSQTYTFYTQSDDGARLWVNGQLIIDKWIDQGPTEWSGQITLQAGRKYELRMEFYERWHGALAKLLWSSASQAKEAVPASQLTPPQGASAVKWLVTDQLGTPRMVLDRTAALSKVTRHDYLPFGEELGAGVGGRSTNQGYGLIDSVRQKFTGYERDGETSLDYAKSRYFASVQGRFVSVDPLLASGKPGAPQSWNRYTYCLNNPLILTDPTGLIWVYRDMGNGVWNLAWIKGNKISASLQRQGWRPYSGPTRLQLAGGSGYVDLLHNGKAVITNGPPMEMKNTGQGYVNMVAGYADSMPGGQYLREAVGYNYADVNSGEYKNVNRIATGVGLGKAAAGAKLAFAGLKSLADDAGKLGDDLVDLFHGSYKNADEILESGLDVNRSGATYVSPDLAAAEDAVRARVITGEATENAGVITSRVPRGDLQALINSGDIKIRDYQGFYPSRLNTVEYQLFTPAAKELFNKGMQR